MLRTQSGSATRLRASLLLTAVAALVAAVLPAPNSAATAAAEPPAHEGYGYGFQGEGDARLPNVDNRGRGVAPTQDQVTMAQELGAAVRWNPLGTPRMMSVWGGFLSGPADGEAVDVARAWIDAHRRLFRLTAADVAALEVQRDAPLYESPDRRRMAMDLKPRNTDVAHAVLFRQRLGDLDHGLDGQLGVGVDADGRVVSVWSSVTGMTEVTNTRALSWRQAYLAAAADAGRDVAADALTVVDQATEQGFRTFRVPGSEDLQYVRPAAVPTPRDGVRLAWETVVLDTGHDDGHPEAYIHFIDAETGEVLHRANRVDHFAAPQRPLAQADEEGDGTPYWTVFPAYPRPVPPLAEPVEDIRQRWCWVPGMDCDLVIGPDEDEEDEAQPLPWDVDPRTGQSTQTTEGNNARTAISEQSPFTPDVVVRRPISSDRTYEFDWTNVWFTSDCDPTNFDRPDRNNNDEDAATVDLFVGHNRIHDWGYYLGWTEENSNLQRDNFGKTSPGPFPIGREEDPEFGQSQAGRQNPAFLGRDNANQITLQDGTPGITNQYLWQPLQAGFYAPCVDGAYDMSIVAHEVGHAIQHRMTGGPDQGLAGDHGFAMGESWSDLTAMEYLNGNVLVPIGDESPYAVGPYATGDNWAAIRNYNMSVSPLNFSDMEYDGNGTTSPHADGEIWSAVNFDIRQALIDKYDDDFPADDADLQRRCADGELEAERCPGNRRWVQLFHDAFLLQPSAVSMIDARDAYLAADMMRTGGDNQAELWDAFAARGLGEGAATTEEPVCTGIISCPPGEFVDSGANDPQPTPGWTSPTRNDHATVTFEPAAVGDAEPATDMEVYVGVYEARVTPAADTDPETDDISDTVKFNPGTYRFIARAPGYGAYRFTQMFEAGETTTVPVPLRLNHASFFNNSEATGDGGNLEELIDDTERTNWASFNEGPVQEKEVTVKLGKGRQTVREIQVSAALRPAGESEDPADERPDDDDPEDEPDDDPPYDTGGQNRFSALRSFEILVCDDTDGSTCEADEDFTSIYTSPDDAFPAIRPRPRAPELTLRSFDVPDTPATHVRIQVLENQCSGQILYSGEMNPDSDPKNDPDCMTGFSTIGAANTDQERRDFSQAEVIRIAELQVFAQDEPFLGNPCAPAQVAASYVDRPQARAVHQRSVDCVIYRQMAIGIDRGGEKLYLPAQDVTRGQMASFVVNTLVSAGHGDRLPTSGGNEFHDIDGHVHAGSINTLARADIIASGGNFRPNRPISREQMASFMVQAYLWATDGDSRNGEDRFTDVAPSNPHRGNIEAGAVLGLFTGTSPTTFAPQETVKRDQMATFLVNLLRRAAPQFRG